MPPEQSLEESLYMYDEQLLMQNQSAREAVARIRTTQTLKGLGVVTEGMQLRVRKMYGPTCKVKMSPPGDDHVKPKMWYAGKHKNKIREWFHIATAADCANKCRHTPNCAYFNHNKGSTQCFLKDIGAKKHLKPHKYLSAGSVVEIKCGGGGGGAKAPAAPAAAGGLKLTGCPARCWRRSKVWLSSTGLIGLGLAVFVFAIAIMDGAELKSWLYPSTMSRSVVSSVGRGLVCLSLLVWFVLGSEWIWGGCNKVCAGTPLWQASGKFLLAWIGLAGVLLAIMLYLLFAAQTPKGDGDAGEMLGGDEGMLYYPTDSRLAEAMYYYPPRWVTTRDKQGKTVRVYYPPRWAPPPTQGGAANVVAPVAPTGRSSFPSTETPVGYLTQDPTNPNQSRVGDPPPYTPAVVPMTTYPPPLRQMPHNNRHASWR